MLPVAKWRWKGESRRAGRGRRRGSRPRPGSGGCSPPGQGDAVEGDRHGPDDLVGQSCPGSSAGTAVGDVGQLVGEESRCSGTPSPWILGRIPTPTVVQFSCSVGSHLGAPRRTPSWEKSRVVVGAPLVPVARGCQQRGLGRGAGAVVRRDSMPASTPMECCLRSGSPRRWSTWSSSTRSSPPAPRRACRPARRTRLDEPDGGPACQLHLELRELGQEGAAHRVVELVTIGRRRRRCPRASVTSRCRGARHRRRGIRSAGASPRHPASWSESTELGAVNHWFHSSKSFRAVDVGVRQLGIGAQGPLLAVGQAVAVPVGGERVGCARCSETGPGNRRHRHRGRSGRHRRRRRSSR